MAQAIVRLRATMWGELLAEFLGTFVLIAFGDGVVAMAVAALNQSGRGTEIFAASGDWLLIAWGWALAVAFGVYVAGGVSGVLRLADRLGQGRLPRGPRLLLGPDHRPADRRGARRLRLRPVRGRHPAGPRRAPGPGRRGVRRDGGGAADDGRRERDGWRTRPHRPGGLSPGRPGAIRAGWAGRPRAGRRSAGSAPIPVRWPVPPGGSRPRGRRRRRGRFRPG